MKKVVSGKELQDKMVDAINLLCDTVKITLGPKGNNVIIDHSTFSPFITNDGVTIAENITSEDEVINTILELAKEASIKTNANVGDGTTTTLVLLQSIFNEGIKLINNGFSPIVLKRELDNYLDVIISKLKSMARIPSKEELKNVAIISSNDEEIGKNITNAYLKVLNRDAISIKEGEEDITKINYLKGYMLDSILASPYFLKGLNKKIYNKPYLLLINNNLDDIEYISNIINKIIDEKENLIIIASDYTEDVIQNILEINMNCDKEIILLKTPEFGFKQLEILKDLEIISNAKIINDITNINNYFLGKVSRIEIDNEKVIINYQNNNNIKDYLVKLKKDLKNTTSEKEFISSRINMFKKGKVEILVGAKTTTERREAKMRYDDALWAISTAKIGILPGSGITLAIISDELNDNNNASIILKIALNKPLRQILDNSSLNYEEIYQELKNNNFNTLYNINTSIYEDIKDTLVIDPLNVVINAIKNAISIAGMLLTTTSIIINEYQNNMNIVNNYTEM